MANLTARVDNGDFISPLYSGKVKLVSNPASRGRSKEKSLDDCDPHDQFRDFYDELKDFASPGGITHVRFHLYQPRSEIPATLVSLHDGTSFNRDFMEASKEGDSVSYYRIVRASSQGGLPLNAWFESHLKPLGYREIPEAHKSENVFMYDFVKLVKEY